MLNALLQLIVGNAFPPADAAMLRSRVLMLASGNLKGITLSHRDAEDDTACLLTLFAILAGVLAFMVGHAVLGIEALVRLSTLLAAASYVDLLWHILKLCLVGVSACLIGMFIASRAPLIGLVTTLCLFVVTLTVVGCVFSRSLAMGVFVPICLCGGVLNWSYQVEHRLLSGVMRVASILTVLVVAAVLVTQIDGTTFSGWQRLTVIAKIVVPVASLIGIIVCSFFLGALFEATTSASSANVSPMTTSAYAIGIVSAAIWLLFMQFVLRMIYRKRAN